MGSRKGGIRNLSMKKLGTPIGAGPGTESERLGLEGVGAPPGVRVGTWGFFTRVPAVSSIWVVPKVVVEGEGRPGRRTVVGCFCGLPPDCGACVVLSPVLVFPLGLFWGFDAVGFDWVGALGIETDGVWGVDTEGVLTVGRSAHGTVTVFPSTSTVVQIAASLAVWAPPAPTEPPRPTVRPVAAMRLMNSFVLFIRAAGLLPQRRSPAG